jgi:predicted amidohydrolase
MMAGMKDIVRTAAVQMEVKWLDPEANLAKVADLIERIAQEHKADLIVFPELVNSGYVIGRHSAEFQEFSRSYLEVAERIPGQFTDTLGELAKKHAIHIVIGLLEAHPSIPATLYNSSVLIGPSGEVLTVYRKVHIPAEERHYFYSGSGVNVVSTKLGNIGLMICADIAFPELARVLTLKGAEIICVCFCRPKGVVHGDVEAPLRFISCRAFENNNFLVASNRVGREGDLTFDGKSCICGPYGEFLARSDAGEDIIIAELLADELKAARMRYTRFRDRRPELYGIICQPTEASS